MKTWSLSTAPRLTADGDKIEAAVTIKALSVAAAIATGLFACALSNLETKWIVYIIAAQLFGVVALLTGIRTCLLAAYVLALQLNVHYWITEPMPHLHVGLSGATSISIALVSLPALALLLHYLVNTSRPSRPTSSAIVTRGCIPPAALIMVTAASALGSNVRFQGICTLIELLQLALVFFVAAVCIRSRKDVELVYKLLIATMVIQATVYFAQIHLGISFSAVGRVVQSADDAGLLRPGGTVSSAPADFAAFMEPLILITAAAFFAAQNAHLRTRYMVLLGIAATALLFTLNRTTLVEIPVGVAISLLLTRQRNRLGRGLMRSAAALILVGACAVAVAGPTIALRLKGLEFSADWETRLNLMTVAFEIIKNNPILGIGPGAYGYNIEQYETANSGWVYVVHNEYLMKWADLGTVGILAWCAWLGSGVRRAFRCTRINDPVIASISIGFATALVLRMWNWLWWSHYEFSPEALLWLLLGLMVSFERIAREQGLSSGQASLDHS